MVTTFLKAMLLCDPCTPVMPQCTNVNVRSKHQHAPAVQQCQQPRRSIAVTGACTAQELHDDLNLHDAAAKCLHT